MTALIVTVWLSVVAATLAGAGV
ncbi:hypothetical protein CP082626L3_0489A, partial [Chlamydia psittaci 08-2626_L3]